MIHLKKWAVSLLDIRREKEDYLFEWYIIVDQTIMEYGEEKSVLEQRSVANQLKRRICLTI